MATFRLSIETVKIVPAQTTIASAPYDGSALVKLAFGALRTAHEHWDLKLKTLMGLGLTLRLTED